MKARTPKGTRDFNARELAKRHHVTSVIQSAFKRYGYAPLETPSFELSETLMGKYGEEGDRLIFKLLKSGNFMRSVAEGATPKTSDIIDKALRYDLTVPFARYVVENFGQLPMPFKRYQIQPVWRADKPQKGRFREFYQCDADVVGSQSLWQEVELINLYAEVFEALNLPVVIRLNHRGILSGIAEMAGVGDRLTEFTVALDKLDKIGQEGVVAELKDRGFSDDAIKKLSPALIPARSMDESLTALDGWFEGSETGLKGIEDLR
ncbi:MAG: ATP phosphoribosyltransferase regulatory subunit, partial [Schleiferiaceae bacterium]|nr:ATP phosphoribosyltransferase regulatory subunit [Schleiferiaceae bacterium]